MAETTNGRRTVIVHTLGGSSISGYLRDLSTDENPDVGWELKYAGGRSYHEGTFATAKQTLQALLSDFLVSFPDSMYVASPQDAHAEINRKWLDNAQP